MRNLSIIVIVLALLNTLESLSIDLYLPAFPSMAKMFQTEIGNIQISISTFFAGFAIGQLLWGYLSDIKGRKPILYIGLIVFIVATIIITFTKSHHVLWLMRFIQAFGGSAGIVVGRAIVTDLYDKKKSIQIFASQSQISGIAPIVAPLLGSVLLKFWGWESAFVFLSILGALTLLLTIKYIPETNSKNTLDKPAVESNTKEQIKQILKNRDFLQNTIVGSIAFASLIIYISVSPFLFMEVRHFSTSSYSLIFAFNSFALIIAAYCTPKLLHRITEKKLLSYAVLILFSVNLLHIIISYFNWSATAEILALYFSLLLIGVLFPITTAGALSPFKEGKGVAASLFGFIQLMITFLVSSIVGFIDSETAMPTVVARALLALSAICVIFSTSSNKKRYIHS